MNARVEDDATLGPFARLRRGTRIERGAEIGNFIEIKQATIGRRVKAHHVGYIGDATVGEGANIGAGVVTCNYDGMRKHQTRIGARAFVGTNASLVAPLTIGDDAYVGAGSVITQDVPPGALAVERAPQDVKEGWTARRRARPRVDARPGRSGAVTGRRRPGRIAGPTGPPEVKRGAAVRGCVHGNSPAAPNPGSGRRPRAWRAGAASRMARGLLSSRRGCGRRSAAHFRVR